MGKDKKDKNRAGAPFDNMAERRRRYKEAMRKIGAQAGQKNKKLALTSEEGRFGRDSTVQKIVKAQKHVKSFITLELGRIQYMKGFRTSRSQITGISGTNEEE